ncbi:putative chromatin regulator PHD family [Helianthus annuus]|nr:putative chromatin regulator PHD family [Helianthus annuus]
MCKERIWSFHLCYYYCKSCDYSLHKFCAELPDTLQNNPLHPDHNLKLLPPRTFKCHVCNLKWKDVYCYYCGVCRYRMCIICATTLEQKINHASHPHQLERLFGRIVSPCVACGNNHEGIFFQCTTCLMFRINLDCALMPAKLLIQNSTNGTFSHSHPLTLAYSFPRSEYEAKFEPRCRVCNGEFLSHLWNYKCDKCRYYVHVNYAALKTEPFMSIFLPPSLVKNYREDEHPNLLNCPFQDEGDNLLKHHMCNQKELIRKQHEGDMFNHSSHQHPLILLDKQTSVGKKTVSLHDPMKKVQLLCVGCVKPIMTVPFYVCCHYVDEQCCLVLHEWCAKLPSQIQDYFGHPEHPLVLLPKIPSEFFGVFECEVCGLRSNGFAYGCTACEYYVDINCAFIPEEITHDAHPDHLLLRVKASASSEELCKACDSYVDEYWIFQCASSDFYIHVKCALLLPKMIKHKCDKHYLSLRYEPVENHIEEYFCEICEDEFNPWRWFYHCTTCSQSMHTTCVPLILQYEQATKEYNYEGVYEFLNIKFGGTLEVKDHPHRLSFVQGVESDGNCSNCRSYYKGLKYKMIFKCMECEFALHYECASSFVSIE